MGLDITVGILLAATKYDKEAFDMYQRQFMRVNQALQAVNMPPHIEPATPQARIPWYCQMWGYAGLHYLRRLAAYLWSGQPLPSPGTPEEMRHPQQDPYVDEAYAMLYAFEHPFAAPHLLFHSDSEGFYLPQEFTDVIYPDDHLRVPGNMIGSAVMLQRECARIARVLEIPPDLDPEDQRVWQAASEQDQEGSTMWQHYGIESFTCIRLLRACELSSKSGCAIMFH